MTYKIKRIGGLIIVPVTIMSDKDKLNSFDFILDTGSTHTIIIPDVIEVLGYALNKSKPFIITTGTTDETAWQTNIKKLSVYEIPVFDFGVFIKKLPEKLWFTHGLLGLDFFEEANINLHIDFKTASLQID